MGSEPAQVREEQKICGKVLESLIKTRIIIIQLYPLCSLSLGTSKVSVALNEASNAAINEVSIT